MPDPGRGSVPVPPDQRPVGSHSRAHPCAAGSSCLIRGVMSASQRFDSRSERPLPYPVSTSDPGAATILLVVGLAGAGKPPGARELAAVHRALRLTPDEWMIPLFGEPLADGKRFVLEGRLISVALRALRLGGSVVLAH